VRLRQAASKSARLSQISQISYVVDCKKGIKIRPSWSSRGDRKTQGVSQHGCLYGFRCCKQKRLLVIANVSAWRWQFRYRQCRFAADYPRRAAVISWIFFDWAAQPYFTLITTFVFAPYSPPMSHRIPQRTALLGFRHGGPGFDDRPDVAGAGRDRGRQRPPQAVDRAFGTLLVIGSCLMWSESPATPGDSTAAARLCDSQPSASSSRPSSNNAMMPSLVRRTRSGDCPAPAGPRLCRRHPQSHLVLAFSPPIPKPAARCSIHAAVRS